MPLRTIDSKIGLRFTRSVNLGPDAGIVGFKRTVFQARPVAAHVAIKLVRARRIDGVVDSVYILEIGSQDALATQVAIKLGAKNKGQLGIDLANLDVLDDLITKLRPETSVA